MSIKEFLIINRSKIINVAPFAQGNGRLEAFSFFTFSFGLKVQKMTPTPTHHMVCAPGIKAPKSWISAAPMMLIGAEQSTLAGFGLLYRTRH